uniref:Ligand dependent nuclear receptor corepressor-like n=2 Tax=Mastacembelus armatus TaxID=205130 RepID=A0A7N8Y146_9TELE
METYTILCPKRLHCISCQSLAVGHIKNIVCSFASSPPLSKPPPLCTPPSVCSSSSICCNRHNPHSCPCYSNHACVMQVRNTTERGVGDGDPPCPVLKREQSPSPPPLSPVSSDSGKKTDEKPPSLLHHRQEEEADLMVKNNLVNARQHEADVDTATEKEQECMTPSSSQAEQNPTRTILQEVVNRFSEKLETIRPLEKDPPLVSAVVDVSEREQLQSPLTTQNLQFQADAHLTEIITEVLHEGSASDYNLSELFNRHDNKEPKSPNTRSRRRQEVLAAIATPADDASTRRHTLQIKRELARLDQSYNKKKGPPAKKARLKDGNDSVSASQILSDSNLVKEESKKEIEVGVEPVDSHRVKEGPLIMLSTESDRDEVKEEIQTVIITEEVLIAKAEEISSEQSDFTLSEAQRPIPELPSKYDKECLKDDSVQTQAMTLNAASAEQYGGHCEEDAKGSDAGMEKNHEETPSAQSSDNDNSCSAVKERRKCQLNHYKEARKSRRNIVPPQRFAPYVTEPRKMFFVACFSESIFNQQTRKDKVLTFNNLDSSSTDTDAKDTLQESVNESSLYSPEQTGELDLESVHRKQCNMESEDQCQVFPQTVTAKEKSLAKNISENRTDSRDCAAKPFGRLRTSPKRLQVSTTVSTTASTPKNSSNMNAAIKSASCIESPLNSQLHYTSPIKLMFVSPVKDKEGLRYSLKSAGSGSSTQADEPFDPCEVSSWLGTLEKRKRQGTESATSPARSVCSPTKSASSPSKSAFSTPRSASSPSKSASSTPRSVYSPSKSASSTPRSASSPSKSASSTPRSASSPRKSASSTPRSASSPSKSASSTPRSASSPSKSASSTPRAASSPSKSASSTPRAASSPSKSASSTPRAASSPSKSASSTPRAASSPSKSASSTPRAASSPSKSASSTPRAASSPSKSASSTPRAASSPSKSASSTPRAASSPRKSASSSPKSAASPKSACSSPKIGFRRSGEGTPTKRAAGTDTQRSPLMDLLSFHETTPPKRRPGRPKKLGPQLEQKVKRPIGRPRKQNVCDSVIGAKTVNSKAVLASGGDENINKNLKITVVYGRSRRNKRMVSEGFDQLQTEFSDAWQAVGLKSDFGILMHSSKTRSGSTETVSRELSEELNFVSPVKESAPQSSSNIKCQKRDDSVPSRKPGRPAKVRISGISVTVTTVSPRQRKIRIDKDTRQSSETLIHEKVPLPEFRSPKEPWTISHQSTSKSSQTEKGVETKDGSQDKQLNQPVAVRHSMRVRKPSIHFLHAVATSTSRSYSHSNALLRRSKQLLLNKASNERKKEEQQSSVETSGDNRRLCGKERNISQDLNRVADVSVDSIFTPKETLRWWAASAEERTMNQELARRIRLISDTWVSDNVENQEKEAALHSKLGTKNNSSFPRKSKHSSVVRTLFDCPPNKPRSCSMQQLCSWFMQTTETQSLAIVKKASSRNPYEVMHFPRSASKKSVCHSPQAERLRKHIKKFAKTVPKSPLQHQQAQRRLRKTNKAPSSTQMIRRKLFTTRFARGQFNEEVQWCPGRSFSKYLVTLFRARTRFLTQRERERWQKRQRNKNSMKAVGHVLTGLQPKRKALHKLAKHHLSDHLENSSATSSVDQTQEPVDVSKEQNLCSKAWSPERLKECRVFLRKINSPDNESTEEEWDSCTVTLDDGSPSAYVFAGKGRELVGVVKAVKTERKRRRSASRELASCAPKSVQEQVEIPVGGQKSKYRSPGVVSTEPPQPPPAKMLRQSRMRGLTGPRWCDFVFEN